MIKKIKVASYSIVISPIISVARLNEASAIAALDSRTAQFNDDLAFLLQDGKEWEWSGAARSSGEIFIRPGYNASDSYMHFVPTKKPWVGWSEWDETLVTAVTNARTRYSEYARAEGHIDNPTPTPPISVPTPFNIEYKDGQPIYLPPSQLPNDVPSHFNTFPAGASIEVGGIDFTEILTTQFDMSDLTTVAGTVERLGNTYYSLCKIPTGLYNLLVAIPNFPNCFTFPFADNGDLSIAPEQDVRLIHDDTDWEYEYGSGANGCFINEDRSISGTNEDDESVSYSSNIDASVSLMRSVGGAAEDGYVPIQSRVDRSVVTSDMRNKLFTGDEIDVVTPYLRENAFLNTLPPTASGPIILGRVFQNRIDDPYLENGKVLVTYKAEVFVANRLNPDNNVALSATITYSDGETDTQIKTVPLPASTGVYFTGDRLSVVDFYFTHEYEQESLFPYNGDADAPSNKTSLKITSPIGTLRTLVCAPHRPVVKQNVIEIEKTSGGTFPYGFKINNLNCAYCVDAPIGKFYISNLPSTRIINKPGPIPNYVLETGGIPVLEGYEYGIDFSNSVYDTFSDSFLPAGHARLYLWATSSVSEWIGELGYGVLPGGPFVTLVGIFDIFQNEYESNNVVSICEDHDGVMYSATTTDEGVVIRQIKGKLVDAEHIATLTDQRYGITYFSGDSKVLYVVTQDKNNRGYRINTSEDFGRSFTSMELPFDSTFISVRGHTMMDGGHCAVGVKKNGEVYFSRSNDGVNWKPPTLVTTEPGLKACDVYQMHLSGSSELVISDGSTFLIRSRDFGRTWGQTETS